MAEFTIDVVLFRAECLCHLPPNLAVQVAPHRRTCPWLEMYDLISLFMVTGLTGPPEEQVYSTAVLWKQRFWGPDPNSIQVRTLQRRRRGTRSNAR